MKAAQPAPEIKSLKRRMFEAIWSRLNVSPAFQSRLAEYLVPIVIRETKHGDISFYCPGGRTVGRADTLLTKEELTIAWIDSLGDGVFWDIGANIGVFTLYAALKGHPVLAFEPSPMNFAVLSKNIQINEFDASSFCVAFSSEVSVSPFEMDALEFGFAGAGLNTGKQVSVAAMSFPIDEFIQTFNLTPPNFIKIDIDGGENDLLSGARKTFSSGHVTEVQIEVEAAQWKKWRSDMGDLGFAMTADEKVESKALVGRRHDLLFKKPAT
jgi:FkbM family methyltransferase